MLKRNKHIKIVNNQLQKCIRIIIDRNRDTED